MEASLSQIILNLIQNEGTVLSTDVAGRLQLPHQKIVGAVKSLESLGEVVEVCQKSKKEWLCTDEGMELAENGSHEAQLFRFLPSDGEYINNIKQKFSSSTIALGAALKNQWIRKDGDKVYPCVSDITDAVQNNLTLIRDGCISVDDKTKMEYKKRKLIKEMDLTFFEVKKGPKFSTTATKQEADLTKEMLESGQWKMTSFKPINFNSNGKVEIRPGHLHPLMQLRAEFRHIFLEMGFTEMPTNNYVESAFWNFDALFQPQQHPARDAQDTFYVAHPEKTLVVPLDYLDRVRNVHTEGGYGSSGYRSSWSYDESQKNLLRTHTTAVSARLLYKLAQEGFKPVKYFSIDKVYRNETLDATHLAEFYQVEGVIADYNLSVKHLMGMFAAFFEKIGIRKIRFKPTYNPYTEPSMEIYSFHAGLNKWVEVGNSGYFRPEMLRPMGLPDNVTVAGWGLSLERPAMIMFGINNIRELVGSKVKLELILENPICTIDKFGRRERVKQSDPQLEKLERMQSIILRKLEKLKMKLSAFAQMKGLPLSADCHVQRLDAIVPPSDIVINAHPSMHPYSLLPLISTLMESGNVAVRIHTHSSVENNHLSGNHMEFWSKIRTNHYGNTFRTRITFVWKTDMENPHHPNMLINPLTSIKVVGEANIARYFGRLIDFVWKTSDSAQLYEGINDASIVEKIDQILDLCQECLDSNYSKKHVSNLIGSLSKMSQKWGFLCCPRATLADLVALSVIRRLTSEKSSASCLKPWIEKSSQNPLTSLLLNDFLLNL